MTHKIIAMQQTTSVSQLLDWHNQYEMYKKDIRFLMDKEDVHAMRRFYSDNGGRIKTAIEQLNVLMKKYYQFDGENPKTEVVDGKHKTLLLEGMKEEDYVNERNEILFAVVPVQI